MSRTTRPRAIIIELFPGGTFLEDERSARNTSRSHARSHSGLDRKFHLAYVINDARDALLALMILIYPPIKPRDRGVGRDKFFDPIDLRIAEGKFLSRRRL